MNRIVYFDLTSGISGDMLLGALLDLGASKEKLYQVIDKLGLEGVEILVENKEKIIEGKNVKVRYKDQEHRQLSEIIEMIKDSTIEEKVKEKSMVGITFLGKVEAKIHGKPIEKIELHETGMIDSIIDIVGSIALFYDLGFDAAYSSTVSFGRGVVKCSHGILPVPVPATLQLLKGWNISMSEREGELVTPTGALLLKVLTIQESPPDMVLEKVGVGVGDREMEFPNVLRLYSGIQKNVEESMIRLKFYVDDMTPEVLAYSFRKIREVGIEAYCSQALGKKSRPGWEVTVLCTKESLQEVEKIIFEETSTLGIQVEEIRRLVVKRELKRVNTKWGEVRVKVTNGRISPEFEDCKRIAETNGIPLQKVYETVKRSYEYNLDHSS